MYSKISSFFDKFKKSLITKLDTTATIKNLKFWRGKSALERVLTTVIVLVVLLLITLVLIGVAMVASNKTNTELCLTASCIHASAKVLESMDKKVEPCDDFYRFACGQFLKTTIIPDDKVSVNTFSVISDHVQEQLRYIIERSIPKYKLSTDWVLKEMDTDDQDFHTWCFPEYYHSVKIIIEEPSPPNGPKYLKLAKNLFETCMLTTRINIRGVNPFLKILKKLGGWPVLEGKTWKKVNFNWRKSIIKLRKMGYSADYFLKFSVDVDLKNSTKRVINLDQASLGLSREYLLQGINDTIVKAYYNYMVDIATILGADRGFAEQELMESLEFEMQLANISLPNEKRRNATLLYNPMTVAELNKNYPFINWMDYFRRLLPSSIRVEENEMAIVNVPSYIKDLGKLLAKVPKRVQANYAMWRAAEASMSYLNEDVRERQLTFLAASSGRTERESRLKECVGIVAEKLSASAGTLYAREYFDKDVKKNAEEIVNDLRVQFDKILNNADWLDDGTRKSALEKAASMSTHIAYPDELLDDNKVEEFYNNLEVDENDYLLSVLSITLFNTEYSFSKLRESVNKSDWVYHGRPAPVNTFYASIENNIQFPAEILQDAFFVNDRPKYMNYGTIGSVIGHEIIHSFDDQGRQFDKDGNLVDWWAPSTKEKYLEKAQCIINQYGNYTVEEVGLQLDGINTLDENIADNGGLKVAYWAYRNWSDRNAPEKRLPDLDQYSPRQMFWISYANTMCSKNRPESLISDIKTNSHSPSEFRVLGTLSNMEEFAEDFQCPVGSKMNPRKKCRIW